MTEYAILIKTTDMKEFIETLDYCHSKNLTINFEQVIEASQQDIQSVDSGFKWTTKLKAVYDLVVKAPKPMTTMEVAASIGVKYPSGASYYLVYLEAHNLIKSETFFENGKLKYWSIVNDKTIKEERNIERSAA